jgi:hypothetical protein
VITTPKAQSVTEKGEDDGFVIEEAWELQTAAGGDTRLLISVPTARLREVHLGLLAALGAPLSLLYRRKVDRRDPKPNGTPPDDFLAPDLSLAEVSEALVEAADLVWHDARCEVWVRGLMGEQIVLDQDGMLYAYPDDPSFRDALAALGVVEREVPVLLDRDYVKHWFHGSCDALEDALLSRVDAILVSPQGDAG